ncbi:MAG: zinc dependent phospholipase C family protein [bacterium]|nr:zinc dependent phospholipase C family protein [bacterium]
MPTPFTHLAIARRLLADDTPIPSFVRDLLHLQRGAFYLGSIAADGHFLDKRERAETHFYRYNAMPHDPPWRVMMGAHPHLWLPSSDAHRAFIAGYIAHLAVDEYWQRHMAAPQFGDASWGSLGFRFLMLNLMLIHMDERDYAFITQPQSAQSEMADSLHAAAPGDWLPFLSDSALRAWGGLIHRQIVPGGASETLVIIAPRLGGEMTPARLRAMLDSPEGMQRDLWSRVPQSTLHSAETAMFAYCRDQMIAYLEQTHVNETESTQ